MITMFLGACNHTPSNLDAAEEDTIQKVTGHENVTLQEEKPAWIDSSYIGFYQGPPPCNDCDELQQTLLLMADGSFKLEDMVWRKNAKAEMNMGIWSIVKGNIVLFSGNTVIGKFEAHGDTLLTVERQGTMLSDTAARKFALYKTPNAAENRAWQKRKLEGIDFYGIGNEPFWNIEIDNEEMIRFRLADWKEPVQIPAGSPVITETRISYSLSTEPKSFEITILPEFCSDGMSDYLYEYTIKVNYQGKLYKGCGIFLNKKPDSSVNK